MQVRQWMTTVPITIRPDAPVADAQHLMRHRRIRHLPVVTDGRLVGIITDRDVRTAMPSPATGLAAGEIRYLLHRLLVERIMTRSVITISPDRSIADAAGLVLLHRIGALPVMEDDRLAGIITETDLLRAFASGATPAERAARPDRSIVEHTILVPLDGSPGSESVLPAVAELARARAARVQLLRVEPPPKALEAGDRVIAFADQETSRGDGDARVPPAGGAVAARGRGQLHRPLRRPSRGDRQGGAGGARRPHRHGHPSPARPGPGVEGQRGRDRRARLGDPGCCWCRTGRSTRGDSPAARAH